MSSANKIIALASLLLLIGVVVVISFVPWQERDLYFSEHTLNAGELVSGVLVGQTFVAREDNLSGVAIKFATYSNRQNTQAIEFHLRDSVTATSDLRVAVVSAADLRDNQLHRFDFEPIVDSAKKTYFWFVTSPQSEAGNAVTVDLDTGDPYHEGSAYIVRAPTSAAIDGVIIERSGKQTTDAVFATFHTSSLRLFVIHGVQDFISMILGTWDQRQNSYLLWLELFAPVWAFFLLMIGLRGDGETSLTLHRKVVVVLLLGIFVGGFMFRLLYAMSLPITNDEGNYLYDARMLLRGVLAGGDGYVKAPLVIAWIAFWQTILGNTILAGRMAMIFVSALLVFPLYFVGKIAMNQRAGILSAAAWALMGAPAVFGIYVHTQSVALLFGVTGIAVVWHSLRLEDPRARWFIGAGVLFGLGVASRKSILALGLVPLALIFFESWSWSERTRRLLMVGISFVIVMTIFLMGAVAMYGCEDPLFLIHEGTRCMGVEEALGINSAEDGLTAVSAEDAEQVRAYSLRGMTPFFRESLPLIILGVVGWGILLEKTIRRSLRAAMASRFSDGAFAILSLILPKIVWFAPGALFWWAWSFFQEYEGAVFHDMGGVRQLWYAFSLVIFVIAIWPRDNTKEQPRTSYSKSTQPLNSISTESYKKLASATEKNIDVRSMIAASFLPLVWVAGLVFFYMNWIKFHANYLVEFLPPLAVMSGLGAYMAWGQLRGTVSFEQKHPVWGAGRRVVAIAFLLVVGWAFYMSNYITYTYEHTGTFDQSAIQEAAVWAQQNIPADKLIFTGAAVVPYLSGHRVALDIAHPRWYAYEFTRKDTARLNTFLPPVEEMLQAFRASDWFLREQQTGFSFLMEYSEIESSLDTDWELVHEVENLSNPLKFYRRIR